MGCLAFCNAATNQFLGMSWQNKFTYSFRILLFSFKALQSWLSVLASCQTGFDSVAGRGELEVGTFQVCGPARGPYESCNGCCEASLSPTVPGKKFEETVMRTRLTLDSGYCCTNMQITFENSSRRGTATAFSELVVPNLRL